ISRVVEKGNEGTKNVMFDLRGKTAVVTGAGSGIGEAIAVLFAEQGARVLAFDISESAAGAVVAKLKSRGGDALPFVCDVADAGAVEATFRAIDTAGDRIDILVNNAGI